MEHRADLARQGPAPTIPTVEAVEALRAQPRFRQAVAAAAANSVDYYQGRWLASRVLNDRARFVIASLMLFLHFNRDADVPTSGLTAARLREICDALSVCSPGRVEATLLMMRASAYLERAEAEADRRVRRYVPTAKMIDLHRERHRWVLSAIDTLRGETNYATRICGDNEGAAYQRFVSAMGRGYLAGFRLVDSAPEVQKIIDRDVGLPIMICLYLASPDCAPFVSDSFRTVSVAGLARRFNVSRVHVRSVLRDAEAAGLVLRNTETAQVAALPSLIDAMERFFAAGFLFTGSCAQIALADAG